MQKTLLLFFILFCSLPLLSQDSKPVGKLTGVLFGDYFYKINGDSTCLSNQYSQYKKSTQGFSLRRTRLHYEHYFNENFTGNFGIESNEIIKLEGKISLILYDANFEWKNAVPKSSLLFGLMPAPTFVWGLSEKIYGYRSVERTVADKNGFGTATDFGVCMKGNFGGNDEYGYNIMIGNGKGLVPEVSKYLKFYTSFYRQFLKSLYFEAYADYQSGADNKYRWTTRGLLGWKSSNYTVMFEPVFQYRNNASGGVPVNPYAFTINGKVNLIKKSDVNKSEIVNLFGRYDFFNPDSNTGSSGFVEHFINAGVDIIPLPNFHIIPNIWMTFYKDKSISNISRNSDIVGRITFWFVY
jgi:hypothetical protein